MLEVYVFLLIVAVIILHGTIMYKKSKNEHKQFLEEMENRAWRKRDESWMNYKSFV